MEEKKREPQSLLEIIKPQCAGAFECCPEWKLEKSIKTCDCDEKHTKVCIFEGDSVDVTYKLEAKRDNSGQVCFTWPLTLRNCGKERTEGLKVGVSVSLVDEEDDNCAFLTEFKGFESSKPVLCPGETHQYLLTGCVNPRTSLHNKKLRLSTCGLLTVHNRNMIVEDATIIICIEEGSQCKDKPIIVEDKMLCIHKKITDCTIIEETKRFRECGQICNKAKLVSCDDSPLIGACTKSEASVDIKCAKVCFTASIDNSCCACSWCMCKSSCIDGDKIKYEIDIDKTDICGAEACITAKVCIKGCRPEYDKEFTLTLYKCDYGGNNGIIIDEQKFMLGKKRCFKYNPDLEKIKVTSKDSGHFYLTLCWNKQVYNVATCDACELDCRPVCEKRQISCTPGWNDGSAILTDELSCDTKYSIVDTGTFSSEQELRDFLRGVPKRITDCKKLNYTLKFHKSDRVTNTVKLVCKGKKHSDIIHQTIVDEIECSKKDHGRRGRHDSDTDDSDCDDSCGKPHKRGGDCDDSCGNPHKRGGDCDDSCGNPHKRKDNDCDDSCDKPFKPYKPHRPHKRDDNDCDNSCDNPRRRGDDDSHIWPPPHQDDTYLSDSQRDDNIWPPPINESNQEIYKVSTASSVIKRHNRPEEEIVSSNREEPKEIYSKNTKSFSLDKTERYKQFAVIKSPFSGFRR